MVDVSWAEELVWWALALFLIGCTALPAWMNHYMRERNRRKRQRRHAARLERARGAAE